MRRLAALVALALVALVLAASPVASRVARAAAAAADDLTLLAGPDAVLDTETGGVRVSVQPGGGVWQSAVVTNRGRQRFAVHFGGSDWLQPAVGSVLLEPGASETVRFTVAPPVGTEAGETHATLLVEVEGQPDIRRELIVVVTVLDSVSPTPIPGADAAPESPAEVAGTGTPRSEQSRTADIILLIAIVGGIAFLVMRMIVPSIVRAVKERRRVQLAMTQMSAKFLSRIDARRIRRIVDASAATNAVAMPTVRAKPTRADVRRAERRRRVAARRKATRAADARVRDEARRLASTLWADRIRDARELAEQEAAERTGRIETARRERAELAATLTEERQVAEGRRVARQREIDETRRAEAAVRAQERDEQSAQRRMERTTAAQQAAIDALEQAMKQQREAESQRGRFIRGRSLSARRLANAWGGAFEAASRAQATRTAPLPGEDGTLPPPELRAPVAFLDPLTGQVVRPDRPPLPVPAEAVDDHIDVTALDIEALNRQLASAPSQGTRSASAQRRSSP